MQYIILSVRPFVFSRFVIRAIIIDNLAMKITLLLRECLFVGRTDVYKYVISAESRRPTENLGFLKGLKFLSVIMSFTFYQFRIFRFFYPAVSQLRFLSKFLNVRHGFRFVLLFRLVLTVRVAQRRIQQQNNIIYYQCYLKVFQSNKKYTLSFVPQ